MARSKSKKSPGGLWFHAVLIETAPTVDTAVASPFANTVAGGDKQDENTQVEAGGDTSLLGQGAHNIDGEGEVLLRDASNGVLLENYAKSAIKSISSNSTGSLLFGSTVTVHHDGSSGRAVGTGEEKQMQGGDAAPGDHDTPPEVGVHDSAKPRRKQLRVVTKEASYPSKGQLIYRTEHYAVYHPAIDNRGSQITGPFNAYKRYDDHALFMDPSFDATKAEQIAQLPKYGIRLDDLTVSKILVSSLRRHQLSEYWQGEFDQQAMVRATRVPLGYAAKEYKNVGDIDIDGNVLAEGQQGWYYLWWAGLHLLCGKEGLDAGMYMVRPSFEKKRVPTFGWKISHKAVIQAAPGEVVKTNAQDFAYEPESGWGNGGFCGC
ncbi:MAG: hypothetical protein Q9201_001727 [Fulgogasparrea decipioides]